MSASLANNNLSISLHIFFYQFNVTYIIYEDMKTIFIVKQYMKIYL